jgi:2-polyprenyl-3-methyl-5-hydroxy-6-metoxy-1,4-benzoquinol methylase
MNLRNPSLTRSKTWRRFDHGPDRLVDAGDGLDPKPECPYAAAVCQERESLHSAAYFNAARDFWWNRDHLALVGTRLGFADVISVLDVGSGVGHWGQLLLRWVLSPEATVVGVEREATWVAEARERAQQSGLAGRASYQQGVAEALAFADASFDMVTCQTLLIHVADPAVVLGEMLRVVKPGGLVVASEPNNRASLLVDTDPDASVEEIVELLRFYLICERGKLALGEGNSSVGDLLPGYLVQQGAVDIQTLIADKTSRLTPPYEGDEQRALRQEVIDDATCNRWVWSHDETRRLFLAGGGTQRDFDTGWAQRMAAARAVAERIESNTYHGAGGIIHYMVAGRRPSDP